MNLGLKIKIARVKKCLTQQQLADLTGLTKQTICHIEKQNKGTALTIAKVCEALDLKVESLVK